MLTLPRSGDRQRVAAAPQPYPTLGYSLKEVVTITIARALVSTSASLASPWTRLCWTVETVVVDAWPCSTVPPQ